MSVEAQPRVRHPAKFNAALMTEIEEIIRHDQAERHRKLYFVLDPLAGVGTVHNLRVIYGVQTLGYELEPEWAIESGLTVCGDAFELIAEPRAGTFDAVVTSPCYGNRMADHHEAKDTSRRNTYRHALGRPLSDGSSAGLQWTTADDDEYKRFHRRLWRECVRVIKPGGIFVLNIKDHIRKGEIMRVSDWHIATLQALGLTVEQKVFVPTTGNRQGENGDLRVEGEWIVVLRK